MRQNPLSRSKTRTTRVPTQVSDSLRSQMLYPVELRAPEKSSLFAEGETRVN